LLKTENLRVKVDNREVLRGVNIEVGSGEIVLLFGPNGSGKTSLIQTILGNPKYKIVEGRIIFNGLDVTKLPMEKRVSLGISAAFQIPPELKGIKLGKLALKILEKRGVDNPKEELYKLASTLNLIEFLDRDLNVGFSGGEMKRAELLLLLAQKPKLALLDEIDSGVDVENIAVMGRAIEKLLVDGETSVLIVTHTGYIARHIKASKGYVMAGGMIKCYGPADVVIKNVLQHGFDECLLCEVLRKREE